MSAEQSAVPQTQQPKLREIKAVIAAIRMPTTRNAKEIARAVAQVRVCFYDAEDAFTTYATPARWTALVRAARRLHQAMRDEQQRLDAKAEALRLKNAEGR